MTRDLEVRHCRVLLAVHDAGGVGAAARGLGVAQSTVSETLLSLERLLGLPVTLRRPGHGAMLTATAEHLIPHARSIIAASEAALAAVARQTHGTIRLGTVESISSFVLPRPLGAFRQLWPQVEVHISIGLCGDLRKRVDRSEIDVSLTLESSTRAASSQALLDLSDAPMRLVASPGHALARGGVARKAEVRALLLADHEGALHEAMKGWAGRGKGAPRLESAGSIDGVKRGVLDSEAIGILPDYAVRDELRAGSLIALEAEVPLPAMSLLLATLRPPHPTSSLAAFVGQMRMTGLAAAQAAA